VKDPRVKMIGFDRYGGSEVLELRAAMVPRVGDHDVLVRVRAASLNPYDWHLMTGYPRLARLDLGLVRPKVSGLGADLSGEVAEVGGAVTEFAPGDEVYGRCDQVPGAAIMDTRAVAEFVRVSPSSIRHKPAHLSHEEAAAAPMAAITALQALRHVTTVRPGTRVLVNGASGGVGTFAVQLAVADGGHVTGVCSTANVDLVRELGAAEVIDYTTTDATRTGGLYDIVLDNVGNASAARWRRVMASDGTYIMSYGRNDNRTLGPFGLLVRQFVLNRFVSQRLTSLQEPRRAEDLDELTALLESRAIRPVVGRTHAMADTAAAMDQMGTEHTRGKLVITI